MAATTQGRQLVYSTTAFRHLVALVALLFVLASCNSSDSDEGADVDLEPAAGDTSQDDADADAEPEPEATPSTESTTTTLSAADEEQLLIDRLMEAATAYQTRYAVCLESPESCEVTEDFDGLISGDLRAGVVGLVDSLRAEGTFFRGLDEELFYRRHAVLFEQPLTYALEACIVRASEKYRLNANGEEELVGDASEGLPVFVQVVAEERPDGSLVLTEYQTNDSEPVEGTCEDFSN